MPIQDVEINLREELSDGGVSEETISLVEKEISGVIDYFTVSADVDEPDEVECEHCRSLEDEDDHDEEMYCAWMAVANSGIPVIDVLDGLFKGCDGYSHDRLKDLLAKSGE